MRGQTPTIHCDADDCGRWSKDYYAAHVSTVGGASITNTERVPGWLTTADYDLCHVHRPTP